MFVRKDRTPNKGKFKKFYRCKKVGHIAAKCRAPAPVAMPVEKAAESAFHSASFSQSATSKWCIDSGATSKMSAVKNEFEAIVESSDTLILANNQITTIKGVGDVRIMADDRNEGRSVIVKNTMSVAKITDKSHEVI